MAAINDGPIVARKHGHELPRKDTCVLLFHFPLSVSSFNFLFLVRAQSARSLFIVVAEAAKQSNAPLDIVNQGAVPA